MGRLAQALQRWAFLTALILLWEALSRLELWPSYVMPGPFKVAAQLWTLAVSGKLAGAVARSMGRLFQGYLISMCIGIPLGIAIARLAFFRNAIKPLVTGLQALPSICWLPLAILWFGLSETAIIFVVVMGSLLAISIASEDGVASIQPVLLQAAGTLGIRRMRLYAGVLVPAALPAVVTGLKLGWSFAWRALMAGELLFVSGGLGELLTLGRELNDAATVLAVMIAIIAVGVAADRLLFQAVEVRVRRRWGLVAAA